MPFERLKQSNKKKNIIESLYDPRCPKPCFSDVRPFYIIGYGCSICDSPPEDPESDDETEYKPYKPKKIYKTLENLCRQSIIS